MKRIMLPLGILLVIAAFLIGRITVLTMNNDMGYVPPLRIIGDVEECVIYNNIDDTILTENIQHNHIQINAIKLMDALNNANPVTDHHDLLLVGEDGLISSIPGENLDECYIAFTQENGWEAINFKHPVSSNIKRIKEIIVVSRDHSWEYGLNIVTKDKNILNVTPGQLYLRNLFMHPYFEGKSSVEHNGQTYETTIYTLQKTFRLNDIIEGIHMDKALFMGKEGDYGYDDGSGLFELKGNSIDYVYSNGKLKIKNVTGVLINPPAETVMDTYFDVLHYIKNDEKVMVLYLDGLGYHQYVFAVDNGYLPYASNFKKAKEAVTVFQPVTNAGFAAMITGKPPFENGVYSRKQKDLRVASFFKDIQELNKKAVLIEGDIKILNTEIPPVLCSDRDRDGSTDNEVFQTAYDSLSKELDLVFVHFHGIDDSGHTYGDLAAETMNTILKVDGYLEKLISNWPGKVIITTDHGMHSTEEGGGHGAFRYEDLIVPYLVFQGEGK